MYRDCTVRNHDLLHYRAVALFQLARCIRQVDATPSNTLIDNPSPGEVICLAGLGQNLARVVFRRSILASDFNSRATIVDKETGTESRPEQTVSVEHHFPDTDIWELSSFFSSKQVKRLPGKFDPPHRPVDYVELISVQIIGPKGEEKNISTREFYVADLKEKSRYPSALIVLMDKIDEVEKAVSEKGKPTAVPSDCQLNPKQK